MISQLGKTENNVFTIILALFQDSYESSVPYEVKVSGSWLGLFSL